MFESEIASLEAQAQAAVNKFAGGVIGGVTSANGIVVNNPQAIPVSGSTTQGGMKNNYWMLLIVGAAVGGYFLLKRKSGRV